MLNQAMKREVIEEIVNDETRKLVGYIMPILEAMGSSDSQKQSVKKILYTYKNNVCSMLNNEMSNDQLSE